MSYAISTLIGYLMPNPVDTYTSNIYDFLYMVFLLILNLDRIFTTNISTSSFFLKQNIYVFFIINFS